MFEGVAPPLPAAQLFFKEELQHWCFAGARKLQMLFPGRGRVLVGLFLFWLGHATVLVQVFNLYIFSSKSTYKAFLFRAITFEPWKRLCKSWDSWLTFKCKVFFGLHLETSAGLLTD